MQREFAPRSMNDDYRTSHFPTGTHRYALDMRNPPLSTLDALYGKASPETIESLRIYSQQKYAKDRNNRDPCVSVSQGIPF